MWALRTCAKVAIPGPLALTEFWFEEAYCTTCLLGMSCCRYRSCWLMWCCNSNYRAKFYSSSICSCWAISSSFWSYSCCSVNSGVLNSSFCSGALTLFNLSLSVYDVCWAELVFNPPGCYATTPGRYNGLLTDPGIFCDCPMTWV